MNFAKLSYDCATHKQYSICKAHLVKKFHRYLEEKWTYSYIDKLDDSLKKINSSDIQIKKLATNKVTKTDVLRLVSLSVETTVSHKPIYFVGHFFRFFKEDKAFRKGYEQSFTDEVFVIADIPKLFPPSYSLINANKEQIEGKFHQSKLELVPELKEETE